MGGQGREPASHQGRHQTADRGNALIFTREGTMVRQDPSFTHVHLLLVTFKSKAYAVTQKTVYTILTALQVYCERMAENAEDMLEDDPAKLLLAHDLSLHREYNKWAGSTNIKLLIEKLHRPHAQSRDLTITMIQSFALSCLKQKQLRDITAPNIYQGVRPTNCCFHTANPTEMQFNQQTKMLACATTSDPMERVYGVFKYAIDSQTNMYLETAAGITAYRLNRTKEWLQQLCPKQRSLLHLIFPAVYMPKLLSLAVITVRTCLCARMWLSLHPVCMLFIV